jgi:Lipocalin-like domain
MKKLISASIIIFLAMASCKKEETEATPQISAKNKFLTSGTWTISAWNFTFNGKTENQLLFSVACERDDSFAFKDGGTWIRNENTQKCNFVAGFDSRKFAGTWKLESNDSKINISELLSDLPTNWDVVELTETTLQISYATSGTTNNGLTPFTSKSVITFKH